MNIKKRFFLLLTFCFISIVSYSLEIKDGMVVDKYNNSVELKEYNRIVLADPAGIEILYMLGAEDKIAAIGKTFMSKIQPVEKTNKLPSVGNITKPSIEKILSFSPDLVILNTMSVSTGDSLKKLKIPFIISETEKIDDIFKNLEIYGEFTGKKAEAEAIYQDGKKRVDTLKAKLEKEPLNLKGAILYVTTPMLAFNDESLPGEIMRFLGVKNIAGDLKGSRPIISQDLLIRENPDFLAGAMSIKSPDDLKKSAILKTTAGKEENLFIVDSSKILRGSPRLFEEMEKFYNELVIIKNK